MIRNCVYRFLNKYNEVIYIGKAKELKNRMETHRHLPDECYSEINRIEYCKFKSEYEMDFAERYIVPKYSPKYNTSMADKTINIDIPEFDNIEWSLYEEDDSNEYKYVNKKKLTLSIEDNLITIIKYVALEQNTTVSELFSEYIRAIRKDKSVLETVKQTNSN